MINRPNEVIRKFELSLSTGEYNYKHYYHENLIEINCTKIGNVYINLKEAILEIKIISGKSLQDIIKVLSNNSIYDTFQLCVSEDDYFNKSLLSTDVLSIEQTKRVLDICDEMCKNTKG